MVFYLNTPQANKKFGSQPGEGDIYRIFPKVASLDFFIIIIFKNYHFQVQSLKKIALTEGGEVQPLGNQPEGRTSQKY